MSTCVRRIICAALVGAGLIVSVAANADVDLVFGIYAADKRIKMIWRCGGLVSAMEEHMSTALEEVVAIEVDINQDYDQGIDDVTAGLVDFARFPNVDQGWVIHPDVSGRVIAAWREAFKGLNFERLPYVASPHIFVEGTYGYCHELERLALSGRMLGSAQY